MINNYLFSLDVFFPISWKRKLITKCFGSKLRRCNKDPPNLFFFCSWVLSSHHMHKNKFQKNLCKCFEKWFHWGREKDRNPQKRFCWTLNSTWYSHFWCLRGWFPESASFSATTWDWIRDSAIWVWNSSPCRTRSSHWRWSCRNRSALTSWGRLWGQRTVCRSSTPWSLFRGSSKWAFFPETHRYRLRDFRSFCMESFWWHCEFAFRRCPCRLFRRILCPTFRGFCRWRKTQGSSESSIRRWTAKKTQTIIEFGDNECNAKLSHSASFDGHLCCKEFCDFSTRERKTTYSET